MKPPMRKLLMQASHIAKVYRPDGSDPTWALRDVNLRIYAGDFVTILGAPGAGKTSLLRILALQEPPTCGELYYEGRLVTGLTTTDLKPDLLLLDEPAPCQADALRRLTAAPAPQAIVLATADPETAALGSTIYRLTAGTLYLIGG